MIVKEHCGKVFWFFFTARHRKVGRTRRSVGWNRWRARAPAARKPGGRLRWRSRPAPVARRGCGAGASSYHSRPDRRRRPADRSSPSAIRRSACRRPARRRRPPASAPSPAPCGCRIGPLPAARPAPPRDRSLPAADIPIGSRPNLLLVTRSTSVQPENVKPFLRTVMNVACYD